MGGESRYAIVGGSSGMGFAVAKRLIDRGDGVLIGGRSRARLESAVARLGPTAQGVAVDAEDRQSLKAFFSGAGPLAGLFTPGATYRTGAFLDPDEALAESAFRSKFWAQYWSVFEAVPSLASGASVVLMAGIASVRPRGNSAAYAACNAAIEGLARGLAVELAPIRVNCLSPGMIDSELWRNRPAEIRGPVVARMEALSALKKIGTVDDAASAVVFMLDNQLMTGGTMYLDGGISLR